MKWISVFLSGVLFSIGLVISGMYDPAIVQGFLDPLGQWNPALALVMAGAVGVTFVGYRIVLGRSSPIFYPQFSVPSRRDIDKRLVIGAVLFGVGWGLVGLCPGPALVSIVSNTAQTLPFFVAMLAGLYAPKLLG